MHYRELTTISMLWVSLACGADGTPAGGSTGGSDSGDEDTQGTADAESGGTAGESTGRDDMNRMDLGEGGADSGSGDTGAPEDRWCPPEPTVILPLDDPALGEGVVADLVVVDGSIYVAVRYAGRLVRLPVTMWDAVEVVDQDVDSIDVVTQSGDQILWLARDYGQAELRVRALDWTSPMADPETLAVIDLPYEPGYRIRDLVATKDALFFEDSEGTFEIDLETGTRSAWPAFGPVDGGFMYAIDEGSGLVRLPTDTGTPEVLNPQAEGTGLFASADDRFYWWSPDQSIFGADQDGKNLTGLAPAPALTNLSLVASVDYVYFFATGQDGFIGRLPTHGGPWQYLEIMEDLSSIEPKLYLHDGCLLWLDASTASPQGVWSMALPE